MNYFDLIDDKKRSVLLQLDKVKLSETEKQKLADDILYTIFDVTTIRHLQKLFNENKVPGQL